jgi:S1-C subfamily serine protease
MISEEVLRRIYSATCSIGYLTVPISEYLRNPLERCYEIVGTGFLLGSTTVITNRHVINDLDDAKERKELERESFFVRFIHLDPRGWVEHSRIIESTGVREEENMDIGVIDFTRDDTEGFEQCQPLHPIDDLGALRVTQEIAVIGYPYGTDSLTIPYTEKKRIYRSGPVVQQGYISALAPYHTHKRITKILLDVRTAKGMSGAPVLLPETGEVIGVHEGGTEGTTAYAIPLDQRILREWFDVTVST